MSREALERWKQAAMERLLDDGQRDERARQLACLREKHSQCTDRVDSSGAQLADYAALASELRPRLAGLAGFNMSLIDDAHHLARELRRISESTTASEQTARTLDLRARIATLLVDRMVLVRAAARVVLRNNPQVGRLAASTFDVRQCSDARRQPAEIEALVERAATVVTS